jgi:hypothetical protein
VGQQVEDELLVGLARGEDAHVRQRRGGQQAAQEVQRLGLERAPVGRVRLAGGRGKVASAQAVTRGRQRA